METMLMPYAEYHHIALPWQQSAPSHWTRLRLKHLICEVDERTQTGEEPLLSLTRSRGLVRRSEITSKPPSARTLVGYKICRPGDIVMNRMQAWSGMFGLASDAGLVSPDYAVLRPARNVDGRFLLNLLKSPGPVSHFAALSTGMGSGFNRLYTDQLGSIPIATPPYDEQARAAAVIREIDRRTIQLIRAKQRLIALLNEQKQGLIQRTVTRGLNPDVPLKSSGVDWLGDVPAHWEISRIKGQLENFNRLRIPLSAVERGRMTSRTYDYYGASGVIDQVDDYLFDGDFILIAEDGANLVLRNLPLAIIAQGKFWVNNHAHILKPRRGNLQFWGYLLETLDYRPWITGAAQPKLTQDRLMAIPIPAPSEEEQDQIVAYVQDSTKQIDSAVQRARSEIELIREYRTRLIADVVTGKLDVRGVAVPEVDGDEPGADSELSEYGESIPDEEALTDAGR